MLQLQSNVGMRSCNNSIFLWLRLHENDTAPNTQIKNIYYTQGILLFSDIFRIRTKDIRTKIVRKKSVIFRTFFAFRLRKFGRKFFGQKYHFSDIFRIRTKDIRRKIVRTKVSFGPVSHSEQFRSEIRAFGDSSFGEKAFGDWACGD
jgi:hypothetical protein